MEDNFQQEEISESRLGDRMSLLEKDVRAVHETVRTEILLVRGDFEKVVEKHSSILERVADKIETAINYQRDSLPIGLVMKLFTFFSVLVVGMLSAILGIKYITHQVFEIGATSSNTTMEQSK